MSNQIEAAKEIPGPKGIIQHIQTIMDIRKDPIEFLRAASQSYGGLVKLRIGPFVVYLVNDADYIKHVIQDNHKNYHKSFIHKRLGINVLGDGLLTSDGPIWLEHRRIAQPAFHKQRIDIFSTVMNGVITEKLQHWEKYAPNAEIDALEEMMQLTLQIIARTMFSLDFEEYFPIISETLELVIAHSANYTTTPLFFDQIPLPHNLRLKASLKKLDEVIYDIIRTRRKSGSETNDLLSMLMDAEDEESGKKLSDKHVRDEALTIILAGHETTANLLTWLFYILDQNTGIEQQLHEELSNVLQGRLATMEDLPNLKYLDAVVKEILRLYPPAWSIARESLQEDQLGPYHVPPNSQLIISAYLTQRNPKYWANPDQFDPSRFLTQSVDDIPKFAYFPFSAGPRKCIGDVFAITEAKLIISGILQTYRLKLLAGQVVEKEPLLTLRPKNGMKMTLSKR